MVATLLRKIYGNSVVFGNLRGERRAAYAPAEELRVRRDERLRHIVRYAAETVPHYRALFAAMKMDPREIRSVDDLNRLPLLDKKTVHQDPDSFISTAWLGKKSIPFFTSGSTGLRLRIQHDPKSMLKNIPFGEREREVLTNLCDRKLGYRELYLGHPQWTTAKVWDFYDQWTFLPVRPQRLLVSVLEPIEHTAGLINQFRPDVIVGWGSYLEFLFRMFVSNGIHIHPPRVLNYGADSMTPAGKRFIEEQFNLTVLSQYNAVECFKIGFFCEQARNFHLHEDLCHVKIIDEKGTPAPSAQKGEVIISNLVNHGTVLLNYRLGDVAALSTENCSCGRSLKLLSELEGRVEDLVFLPDGRMVPPRMIWSVIKQQNEILRYQLIQHEPARFELKVLTADKQTYERVAGGAVADLRRLLGNSCVIDARYAEELSVPTTNKFRPVLSHCKPGQIR
jgi:phenylacetate-CoA ligase